jgi:hypothetical protein
MLIVHLMLGVLLIAAVVAPFALWEVIVRRSKKNQGSVQAALPTAQRKDNYMRTRIAIR